MSKVSAVELHLVFENTEQPPYYMGNSTHVDPDKPGVAVEMMKRLEHFIPELKVTFSRYPWKRCLRYVGSGQADGTFNASFKADRLKLGVYPFKDGKIDPTKRITTIAYSFYVQKGSRFLWDGKTATHLSGQVGAPRGYSIISDLKALGLEVDESNETKIAMKKLMDNRISVLAAQDVTADALLDQYPEQYHGITLRLRLNTITCCFQNNLLHATPSSRKKYGTLLR
ncbi:substrate-binding periplasmic protein [Dongshaea marina]|uniref:substrate-binding periplasmic protein n=1 Tax=Dongshaea marina TaxID=2047966 RepID=UPI000D3ED336|nr:transporter substrate-binding domain-containing protein [Dongshaea marina]